MAAHKERQSHHRRRRHHLYHPTRMSPPRTSEQTRRLTYNATIDATPHVTDVHPTIAPLLLHPIIAHYCPLLLHPITAPLLSPILSYPQFLPQAPQSCCVPDPLLHRGGTQRVTGSCLLCRQPEAQKPISPANKNSNGRELAF